MVCEFHDGGRWEIGLANGMYDVTVSVGDSDYESVGESVYGSPDAYYSVKLQMYNGTLAPEQSIEIYARQAKDDWSDYIQSDDYSFNNSASNHEDWDKVTVYVDGDLLWGEEPQELAPIPTPGPDQLVLQMYNVSREANSNTINPNFKLMNISDAPII